MNAIPFGNGVPGMVRSLLNPLHKIHRRLDQSCTRRFQQRGMCATGQHHPLFVSVGDFYKQAGWLMAPGTIKSEAAASAVVSRRGGSPRLVSTGTSASG